MASAPRSNHLVPFDIMTEPLCPYLPNKRPMRHEVSGYLLKILAKREDVGKSSRVETAKRHNMEIDMVYIGRFFARSTAGRIPDEARLNSHSFAQCGSYVWAVKNNQDHRW